MKTKHFLSLLLALGMYNAVEAQFLKKLKKTVENAVERTVLNRTDREVSQETNKTIDSITKGKKSKKSKNIGETEKNTDIDSSEEDKKAGGIFNILLGQTPKDAGNETGGTDMSSMGEPIPAPPDNNVKLPDSYQFEYQANIMVKNIQGTIETEYYLQPDETYYAKKQTNKDFTEYVVYDNQRNIEVYFADINGKKRKARKKMDLFTKAKMVGAYRDAPNRKVTSIKDKILLGYTCKGYEIVTDAGTTQLWVTNDAPATMYAAMFANRANTPDSPFSENAMIMEVSFTSNESSDKNYQMQCTQLQPNTLAFNDNDYKE